MSESVRNLTEPPKGNEITAIARITERDIPIFYIYILSIMKALGTNHNGISIVSLTELYP